MKRLKSLFLILTLVVAALFSACAQEEKLQTPKNLEVDVDNNLTWSEVSGARTYTVEVTNADTAEKEEKNVRKAVLDLAFLQSGDYVLRVRANSGKQDSVQSAWSAGLDFRMNYTTGCVYELINNNSEYRITRVGTSTKGVVTFENEYRGKPVTVIGEGAFRGSSRVTGIVLGENIRTVEKEAFYNCANLETAQLNERLASIGIGAFQNCNVLKEINIPRGITAIEENTFSYCYSLENIEIGENVQTIGASAFSNCTALKEIVLPDSVVSLEKYAFYDNSAAVKLTIGKNLQTIGNFAFGGCKELSEIVFYGDGESSDATSGASANGSLIEIGDAAFSDCISLKSVRLPETLETLGAYVFGKSENLEKLTIPDSVVNVGALIIQGTAIYKAQEENGYIYADKWLVQLSDAKKAQLSDKNNKVNINVPIGGSANDAKTTETIPSDIRGIAAQTFYKCNGLYSVEIPKNAKTVGAFAFAECEELQSVRSIAGSELRHLGRGAFANCKKLYRAYFPVDNLDKNIGLKTIGAEAFYGTGLGGLIIPSTVISIGKDAYKNTEFWNSAKSVVSADEWVVGYVDGAAVGSVSMAGKKGIADYAFSECDTITAVTDTSDMQYIGKSAFYLSSLKSISLGRKVTEIKPYTFYGCELGAITLPANLTTIGRSAFYGSSLTRIDFSQSNKLERIGEYAFFSSESLERVCFGDTLKEIGDCAFYGCTVLDLSLEGSELPDSLEKIGRAAFRKCPALKTVNFGNGLKEIGAEAFSESGLVTLHLPDGLEKIGAFAFYKNVTLEELTFGTGLKEIGNYAFCSNVKLTEVALPAGLERLGDYAFRECESLFSVTAVDSLQEMGLHAFYWCDFLTVYTDANAEGNSWIRFWNSSYRPVVYSCTLSEDKSYVVSLLTGNTENLSAVGGVSDPYRFGYEFKGWATSADATTVEYTTAQATQLPAGTKLYAVWAQRASE